MAGESSADRSWLGTESGSRRAPRRQLIGRVTRRHRREASTSSSPAYLISLWTLGASRDRAGTAGRARCPSLRAPKGAVHTAPPCENIHLHDRRLGGAAAARRHRPWRPPRRRAVGSRTRFRAKSGLQKARRPPNEALRPGSRPENGPSETETDPTPYASRGQPLTRTSLPSQNRCANASPSQRLTAALAPQPPRTLCTPLHSFAR